MPSVQEARLVEVAPRGHFSRRSLRAVPCLTLTLPVGWRGSLAPNGEWFVLESDSGGGYIVVIGDEMTEAEARRQLSEPVDLGGGIVLTPTGAVQQVASGHLAANFSVSGAQSELVGRVDVRLTQAGLGVAFVLLSPPREIDGHADAMREFAFSLGVTEPTVQSRSGNDEWEAFLRGEDGDAPAQLVRRKSKLDVS